MDHHPLGVDIRYFQSLQFRTTQPGGVHHGEKGSMLQVYRVIEQGPHFLPTQDGGKLSPLLGFGQFLLEPGLFQGAGVEKLQRGDVNPESEPSRPSLVGEV